jgi:hypothetical protein
MKKPGILLYLIGMEQEDRRFVVSLDYHHRFYSKDWCVFPLYKSVLEPHAWAL